MIKNPDPAGKPAESATPQPGPAPGSPTPLPRGCVIALLAPVLMLVLWIALWALGTAGQAPPPGPKVPPGGSPYSQIVFSPGGKVMASMDVPWLYSNLTHVRVSDVATGRVIATVTDRDGVDGAAVSPDGKTLATLDVNGGIYLRDVATGRLIAALAGPAGSGGESGQTLAFSPDGTRLAASYSDGETWLWDVASRQPALRSGYGYGDDPILGIAFSPDGTMLATLDGSGNINVQDAASGQVIASWTTPSSTEGVMTLAFSADGKTLATCQRDGSIYLRDIATGSLAATLTNPDPMGFIYVESSVAFSPDGTLAAAGAHGHVYLWDAATLHMITLTVPGGTGIRAVVFSPDGKTLTAGYGNGRTDRWVKDTRGWTAG